MKVIVIDDMVLRLDRIDGLQLRLTLQTVKIFVGNYHHNIFFDKPLEAAAFFESITEQIKAL